MIDTFIEKLSWFNDNIIWGTWLLVVLLGVGILYTVEMCIRDRG